MLTLVLYLCDRENGLNMEQHQVMENNDEEEGEASTSNFRVYNNPLLTQMQKQHID